MKIIKLLFFILIIGSCKEKTFADDIVLTTDSKLDMKFQEFNEGLDENNSQLIYVGKAQDFIPIKYFSLDIPPPPQIYFSKTEKEKKDSADFEKLKRKFFNGHFNRIQSSSTVVEFDSLTHEKLKIIVKANDTIPHYVLDSTNKIKAYKAFPVFVKNISNQKLKMFVYQFPGIIVLNKTSKWQIVQNNNFFVCGNSFDNRRYWILNPDEIIVFAVNYFKGSQKTRFKIGLTPSFLSQEYEGSINPEVFRKQRNVFLVE